MFYIFLISFLVLFVIIELLQKRIFTHINWARKATHVGSGILSFVLPDFLSPLQIMLLATIFVVTLFVSKQKKILHLHSVKRQTYGEVYFPITIILLAWFFIPTVEGKLHFGAFKYAILILTFCDTFAELIGNVLPLKKLSVFGQTKSIGGSLGFMLTAIVISLLFIPNLPLAFAVFIALILTIVELLSIKGSDNITVPIAASLIYFQVLFL